MSVRTTAVDKSERSTAARPTTVSRRWTLFRQAGCPFSGGAVIGEELDLKRCMAARQPSLRRSMANKP